MFHLPSEIIIQIYEFDETKRQQLQNNLTQIRIKGCLMRIRYITKYWFRELLSDDLIYFDLFSNENSFQNFVKVNLHDRDHIFIVLSKCTCCFRHTTNRPISLNIQYNRDFHDFDESNPHPLNYTSCDSTCINCQCPCRHICRHIYNSYFY